MRKYTEEYILANSIDLPLSGTCCTCGQTKHRQEMVIHKDRKYFKMYYCTDCQGERSAKWLKKTRIQEPLKIYPLTSWASVNQRCVNTDYSHAPSIQNNFQHQSYFRKDINLLITKKEWFEFWNQNEAIVLDIVSKGGIPSVDRIDSKLDYTLSNIRIISREKNILVRHEKYSDITEEQAIDIINPITDGCREVNERRYKKSHKPN